MVDRIEQLITTLEQEINDGYNTLPDYQANDEGKTYVNSAQCTLNELQNQVTELRQGLEQGKNFSLLGESTNG